MGVACLKIEGRMKRPEYVAIVTGVYARALREKREPTAEEMAQLEAAFSRQGFTQGVFFWTGRGRRCSAPARRSRPRGAVRPGPVHL